MNALKTLVCGLALLTCSARVSGQEEEELSLEFLEGLRLQITVERDLDGADRDLIEAERKLLLAIDGYVPVNPGWGDLQELLAATRLLIARVRIEKGDFESARAYLARVQAGKLGKQAKLELERLREGIEAGRLAGDKSEDIRLLAMQNLREGDLKTVRELGTLAVPALVEWIEGRLDQFPDTAQDDPLWMLGLLSQKGLAELVGRHMANGSFLFKKRALRAMDNLGVLGNPSDYEASAQVPKPAKAPEWMRTIEIAAQEPALAAEVMPIVSEILANRACTPRLQEILIQALDPSDARYPHLLRILQHQKSFGDDGRGLLEKALKSPDADLKFLATRHWMWEQDVLHPLAQEPDTRIREALVIALGPDFDSKARGVLELLAADTDSRVLRRVGRQLRNIDWAEKAPEFLPILEVLARNPIVLSDADLRGETITLAERATKHDEGIETLVRLALETGDDAVLFVTTRNRTKNPLFRLPDEVLEAYAFRLYDVSPSELSALMDGVMNPRDRDRPKQPELVRKFHALALKPGLDSGLTLLFGLCDPWTTAPEVRPAIARALADYRWSAQSLVGEDAWLPVFLRSRFRYLASEEVNHFLVTLLRDPSVSDELLEPIVKTTDVRALGGVEVLRAILDRWLDDELIYRTEPHDAVSRSLARLGRFPFEGSDDLLRGLVKEGRYLKDVAQAMGESRDPDFVPDLAAILRDPRTHGKDFEAAFLALRGFLTDETAEILLDLAAETGAGETRDACLATVEDIRAYQDARERWESRKLKRSTRERATAELFELLDSELEAQRVEAVRGLGTLGAVEAIPRLIRMLADPSPTLREAAQTALDRLNSIDEE